MAAHVVIDSPLVMRSGWTQPALKQPGIYSIMHEESGLLYIGSAVSIADRLKLHLVALRAGKHHSSRMQRIFNKYGEACLRSDILEFVDDKAALIKREQTWIDFFKPALNTAKIAGSQLGAKRTAETRARMSAAKLGTRLNLTLEQRQARSLVHLGKPKSAETRSKMSAASIGRKFSEETRARMSASAKLRHRDKDAFGRYI